ncbi:MAG: polysaccharide biosynthesis C-terminal domain-containing protein [Saprospiraceae bacterium]|nr:polysaccharide biosynthesis C-terminal domain-containing protein [Saprospiraceae bacterium]
MPTLKKLAGETVIYGMSHILPRILYFIVLTPYLTYRLKDTGDYGIFSEFYAYTALILSFMTFRMDTAYFRYANTKTTEERDKVYSTTFVPMMVISLLVFAGLMVFAPQVAAYLKYPNDIHFVQYFAWILLFDAATTLVYSKFRLDGKPFRFLFYRVANVLASVLALMLFLEILPRFFPDLKTSLDQLLGVRKDLDYTFFANVVASALVFLLMIPELWRVKFSFDKKLLKPILKYAWPLVVVALAGNINQAFAAPLQKWLLSGTLTERMSQVGIFSAAAKLAILLNLFTTAYNYAAEPFFFNNAAQDTERKMYGKAALSFAVFSSLVVVGIYLFIDILLILIGTNYRSGVFVVPFLLVSYIFLGLYYSVSIWYKLSDNTQIGLWISIFGVFLTLLVSWITIPIFGIIGSAWASVACYGGMLGFSYFLGQKYYPIKYPIREIMTVIGITLLILLSAWFMREFLAISLGLRLTVNILIFGIYCVFVWQRFIVKYIDIPKIRSAIFGRLRKK